MFVLNITQLVTGIDDKKPNSIRDTKWTILNLLLDGSKTAGEIADKLKIQKSAIRTHLESLRAERAIRSYFKTEGLGRPRKVYEITDSGREMFPRKYDLLLSLILQSIEAKQGHGYTKEIITSIADDIAHDITDKIRDSSSSLEELLRILNLVSNEMGFMSSFYKEDDDDNTYSIVSRNCILHKVAFSSQDSICNGFHGQIIKKVLEGKIKPEVQLKECIALGDNYSRHSIAINKNTE